MHHWEFAASSRPDESGACERRFRIALALAGLEAAVVLCAARGGLSHHFRIGRRAALASPLWDDDEI